MKNKWLAIVLIALIGIVAMIGCDNGSTGNNGASYTVYLGGYYSGSTGTIACYWKNGVKTDLSTVDSSASAITVVGTDVYLAGYYDDSGVTKACYWKNSAKTDLPYTGVFSEASGITVVEGVVYTAGYYYDGSNRKACYWKDDVKTDLDVGEIHAIVVVEK